MISALTAPHSRISNGLRPYRPNRDNNPIAFRCYLALYFCSGVALAVWGILALFGAATPIKLR